MLTLFRYRTTALLGSWMGTPDAARADSVRARQASYDLAGIHHWLVPGAIEMSR
jgi:hypothetical protein